MIRKFRKFLALRSGERRLFVQAMAVLPLVALSLRVLGPGRSYRVLCRLAPVGGVGMRSGASPGRRAARTAHLVRVASSHGLFRSTCLAQSLTTWWLLRRQRIATELRIGVRKREGRLEAHAWTQYGSRVLDADLEIGTRYRPFSGIHALFERRGAELS